MESKARRASRQAKDACVASYNAGHPGPQVRPMRALLQHLNQAEPSPFGRERIAHHAETSMRVIQLGLGAIGHLLAHSAVQVEDRTIPAECMESLGTLMAELSELASVCYQLSLTGCCQGVPRPGPGEGKL